MAPGMAKASKLLLMGQFMRAILPMDIVKAKDFTINKNYNAMKVILNKE